MSVGITTPKYLIGFVEFSFHDTDITSVSFTRLQHGGGRSKLLLLFSLASLALVEKTFRISTRVESPGRKVLPVETPQSLLTDKEKLNNPSPT